MDPPVVVEIVRLRSMGGCSVLKKVCEIMKLEIIIRTTIAKKTTILFLPLSLVILFTSILGPY